MWAKKLAWIPLIILLAVTAFFIYRDRGTEVRVKGFKVELQFSEAVRKHLHETGAHLSVQAVVSDQDRTQNALESSVLDLREEVLAEGDTTALFPNKDLEVQLPKGVQDFVPYISVQVLSRLKIPSGNCIQCEPVSLKADAVPEIIRIRCEHWLEMGVCIHGET